MPFECQAIINHLIVLNIIELIIIFIFLFIFFLQRILKFRFQLQQIILKKRPTSIHPKHQDTNILNNVKFLLIEYFYMLDLFFDY